MTDRKRPPPLPPRPLVPEPFPLADSEPPATFTRAATVNRVALTPRDGSVPVYDPDPRDGMIRELQQSLVLLQQQLDDSTPVPLTRPSQRVRRARVARLLGKWAVIVAVLPLVGGVVAKRWPEYSGIVDIVLQLLGFR